MSLGFYTLVPYLALYLSGSLAWSMALTGLLLGARQLSQQGLMFFGGAVADRIGWKRAIVLGVCIRGTGFLGFAWAGEVWHFFAAAIFSGLGGALFEPASKAAFEALVPGRGRQQLIALRDVVSNIAFAVSALLGTLLATVDFYWLSVVAGALFYLSGFIVYRRLPEFSAAPGHSWRSGILSVAGDKPFVVYTILLTGYYYLYTQLWITVPRAIFDVTGSRAPVTLLYGVISISTVLFQLRLSRWVQPFPRRFFLVGLGALLMSLALFSLGHSTTSSQFIAVGLVFAIGTMVSSPVTFELVPTFARREWLGAYYGFNGYALAIGGGLSASLGGWTYDLGAKYNLPHLPWWVCLFTGILVFSGLFVFERRRTLALAKVRDTSGEFCPVQVGAR